MGDTSHQQFPLVSRLRSSEGKCNPTVRQIFEQILAAASTPEMNKSLEYENIEGPIGSRIVDSLDEDERFERCHPKVSYNSVSRILFVEIMPSNIHSCHSNWLTNQLDDMKDDGFITKDERRRLIIRVDTTMKGFDGAYRDSRKILDFSITPRGKALPTIAVESGWSETFAKLKQDSRLWLKGADCEAVILLNWKKILRNRVKGSVWIESLDDDGEVQVSERADIFPVPADEEDPPKLHITAKMLFGSCLAAGRNGEATYGLSIEDLRKDAESAIRLEGFIPDGMQN